MRIALYLRMSSDKQEGSIPQQEKALRAHCETKGYRVVQSYKDEGISGDATEKRKAFLRMIDEASSGKFDRILCWDQDRFGRFDMLEAGVYVSPLRKAGVSLETLAQGVIDWDDFGGRVIYGIAQEGKHQYLRDISRNILRGLQAKAEACNGYPGGPVPFGYRRVTRLETQGGKPARVSHLEIVEAEAAIVRRMFADYCLPHSSANLVVRRLAKDGIATPRGAQFWRRENVARMLACPAYVGIVQWGKSALGKYSTRTPGGGVASRKGKHDRKSVGAIRHLRPDICPPIVDQATFDKVQTLLASRRVETRKRDSIRPLAGLVVCQQCGRRMHSDGQGREGPKGKGEPSYRCSSSLMQGIGKPCSSHRIPEVILLDAIKARLDEAFGNSRGIAELTKRIAKLVEESRPQAAKSDRASALRKRQAGLDKQLADGAARLTLVPAGIVAELAQALDKLRQERDAVAEELAGLQAQATSPQASPRDVVSAIVGEYRSLRKSFDTVDRATINEGLRSLGTAITIDKQKDGFLATVGLVSLPGTCIDTGRARYESPSRFLLRFSVAISAPTPGRGDRGQFKARRARGRARRIG